MAPTFSPPQEFDDYVVVQPLGSGRMGHVYLAEDTVLARHVAVKFIASEPDLAARQRFLIEARTAARVQHPNVVTIYRAGELGDRPYLVTEFVRGQSLAELERPVPWRRALEIGIELARGLAAAHRRGVIHCDIKPANAMVTDDGTAKLVDFGLAALLVEGAGDEPAAGPRGTPDYMAPELWAGGSSSRRSDVYSLGALLFDLLAGRPPHGDVPDVELARAARERDVDPLAQVVPGVDARLAAIVDRCLSRRPEARYPSGEELREALEELQRSAAAGALPSGNPYRGLRPFESAQRALFFGRSAEVGAILDRLRTESFVLVTGDSGVGKSSICRAGVLPAVRDGGLGGGRAFDVVVFVPGALPYTALRAALGAALAVDLGGVEPAALARDVSRHLGAGRGLLVLADQLEELLVLGDSAERASAEEALAAFSEGVPGVRLLATLRADFLARFAALPLLGRDVSRFLYFLRSLPAERIREVIVGPAHAAGARFETEAMVDDLVAGTAAAEGGLPLLQFALAELWEARDERSGVIPTAALERLGGVTGALSRHADSVIAALAPAERQAARRLLLRLVTPQGTRVRRAEADLVASPAERAALDALVRGRLVTGHDAEGGSAYELAHEALIEGWATLARWLAEDAEGRAVSEQLAAATAEWDRLGRPNDALWRGRRLAETEGVDLAELRPREREFVRASRRGELRRRWLARGALPALLALVAAVYAGIKLQAQRAIDAEVDRLLRAADEPLARARAHEERRVRARAAAFAAFERGATGEGERAWAEARAEDDAAEHARNEASRSLEQALGRDATRADTRARFADLLYERAVLAEESGELDRVDELAGRFAIYDDDGGRRRAWDAPATLTLATRPAGASVATDGRRLGETPLASELARGVHTLSIEAPGRVPVKVPLLLRRGARLELEIDLPAAADVPEGFVYIPAGPFLFGSGGDEDVRRGFFAAAPLHERWTGAYLIGRREVTYGEWLAFVDSLPAAERAQRTPGVATKVGASGALSVTRDARGWQIALQPVERLYTARWGEPIAYEGRKTNASVDWRKAPVTGISAEDAEAYADWLARTGRLPGARLCSELEWERAARGADSRAFPHGRFLEPGDANFDETYGRDLMGPDEVGSHPASDSPFGLADMSGNAFEWATSAFTPGEYLGRGGSYFHDRKTLHIMNRALASPAIRDASLGARMCASWPPPLSP